MRNQALLAAGLVAWLACLTGAEPSEQRPQLQRPTSGLGWPCWLEPGGCSPAAQSLARQLETEPELGLGQAVDDTVCTRDPDQPDVEVCLPLSALNPTGSVSWRERRRLAASDELSRLVELELRKLIARARASSDQRLGLQGAAGSGPLMLRVKMNGIIDKDWAAAAVASAAAAGSHSNSNSNGSLAGPESGPPGARHQGARQHQHQRDPHRHPELQAAKTARPPEVEAETGADASPSPQTEANEDDRWPVGCNKRSYTFRAFKSDPASGASCWGQVSASICYGSCDTGEYADWNFPHKKAVHRVCSHGARVRRKILLADCSQPEVEERLREYHYVDALACSCNQCTPFDTACQGSLTRPYLPAGELLD